MANLDDLLDAYDDPGQFGEHFDDASWDAWRALTAALARRPLSPAPAGALCQVHRLAWAFG
jgi:hypothetical protein